MCGFTNESNSCVCLCSLCDKKTTAAGFTGAVCDLWKKSMTDFSKEVMFAAFCSLGSTMYILFYVLFSFDAYLHNQIVTFFRH